MKTRQITTEITPKELEFYRNWVLHNIADAKMDIDRRGYQLIQWPATIWNSQEKPNELSLEHEARLKPSNDKGLSRLRNKLYRLEGKVLDDLILSKEPNLNNLILRRYLRPSGFQSIDHYFDFDDLTFTKKMFTIRQRIKTSPFMTWSATTSELFAINLEMPFMIYKNSKISIRLEFNWLGEISRCWNEAFIEYEDNTVSKSPFNILWQNNLIFPGNLQPVIEHTTFREKFGVYKKDGEDYREVFVINIDQVVAQSLSSKRFGTYVDVDISSVNLIENDIITDLEMFVNAFSSEFDLKLNDETKVYRDASILEMI
ncbi:hypothetical protein [Pedobacter alluvionis]|uniref:CYTH domain-containing protein n=1 Tax=Pedobacter alluvionis TaxID=475253 RepID=A0A497YBD8_9SPHI|nr:hypothetical protein [Pedobacter alluvionis]RLJ80191.1 hypothetical protein BCL90_0938 [Pedobacter alluvionis]TFB31476.1 hypothetical protein E3V97_12840 [Pedobacter alluvionis]